MAARRTGLGKGLDGLFPSYTSKTAENDSASKNKTDHSTGISGPKKKAVTDAAENAASDIDKNNDEDADQMKQSVTEVDINEVEPNPDQPRKEFEEEALKELSESIRQYGVIQPLVVQKRNDYYEIIAGERRWRAAKLAGMKKIPVVIRDYSDQEIVEISLIENIQREDLNPIEEALAYQHLMNEYGLKQDDVAQKVSKNRTTITNSLRLLKLDKRVQQMLVDGAISSGHARALLSIEDQDQQYAIAQKVRDEHLSVRDIEKLMKQLTHPKKEKKKPAEDPAIHLIYANMEEKLKSALGTRVVLNRKDNQRGNIQIEYYSDEELERIYDLLSSIHQ